jgi:hypothetical protein
MSVVAGSIVFGADFEPFVGATVYVRLEDVSRINASAFVVAQSVLPDVQAVGQIPGPIEFTLDAPPLDPRAMYVVRIHVDVDADGQVGIGDYVSTISHPVKVGVGATTLIIPVKRVA